MVMQARNSDMQLFVLTARSNVINKPFSFRAFFPLLPLSFYIQHTSAPCGISLCMIQVEAEPILVCH